MYGFYVVFLTPMKRLMGMIPGKIMGTRVMLVLKFILTATNLLKAFFQNITNLGWHN